MGCKILNTMFEPAPVDGERAHPVERRGLPVDGAGGRPGGAAGELILADLVGGQRGGSCGAAEERGEMTSWGRFTQPATVSTRKCSASGMS